MFSLQQIKKYLNKLAFFIFFFANTSFLKVPIVWSNILSLGYLKELLKSGRHRHYLPFFITLMAYLVLHYFFAEVEDWEDYFKTALYLLFMFLNLIVASIYIEKNLERIPAWMRQLSTLAFAVFFFSFIFLFFDMNIGTWQLHEFGFESNSMHRYQALVYEPSYYALMMSPLLIYFLMKFLTDKKWNYFLYLTLTLIPIGATFSFGLFSVLLASLFFLLLIILIAHRFIPKFFWLPLGFFAISIGVIMLGDNIVKDRIVAITNGEDTSVRGRTYEAYYLANEMAKEKNHLFGIGLGQIKTTGERHIRPYYNYPKEEWPVVAIPNAMAETLAIFGISGVILRIGLLIFLFFKFSVYQNYFRLTLFCFLFLYQFVGSFITSSGEYCLWIMSFYLNFESLDIVKEV